LPPANPSGVEVHLSQRQNSSSPSIGKSAKVQRGDSHFAPSASRLQCREPACSLLPTESLLPGRPGPAVLSPPPLPPNEEGGGGEESPLRAPRDTMAGAKRARDRTSVQARALLEATSKMWMDGMHCINTVLRGGGPGGGGRGGDRGCGGRRRRVAVVVVSVLVHRVVRQRRRHVLARPRVDNAA